MLGCGRPFVLEMIDSKKALTTQESQLKEMEQKINESKDVSFYIYTVYIFGFFF